MKKTNELVIKSSRTFYLTFFLILTLGIIISLLNVWVGGVLFLSGGWWLIQGDFRHKKYYLNGGFKYGLPQAVVYGIIWTVVLYAVAYFFLQSQLEVFFG